MTWMGGWGWSGREAQQGEDVCIHIADSLHCTAKTNNTVKQLYSNKKEKRELFGLQKLEKAKKKKNGFSSRISRKMGSSDFNLRETNFIL